MFSVKKVLKSRQWKLQGIIFQALPIHAIKAPVMIFWWDYRCSNEGNMEINSNLLIISETIARTMSSATTLLLCSHSVHLKPRESEFIFWRDFSHNNPQQCDPLSREGASSSSSRCTKIIPPPLRFWSLNWFQGQLSDATFPPFFNFIIKGQLNQIRRAGPR